MATVFMFTPNAKKFIILIYILYRTNRTTSETLVSDDISQDVAAAQSNMLWELKAFNCRR